jgi:hypothetical protein
MKPHTWCLDCGTPTTTTRCPPCQHHMYGHQHQTDRRRWTPQVATGTTRCWRCAQPIQPNQHWDLGHRTGRPSHPEHANTADCTNGGNRATNRGRA